MAGPWLRIDDRLLHAQVLYAWAAALRPRRVLLAHDVAASDPVRRRYFRDQAQGDYEVDVVTVAEAAPILARGGAVLAVCASPADALRLVDLGAPLGRVQIGGLHPRAAKRQLLPYVGLSRADAEALQALLARGVAVEARDLPSSPGVELDAATIHDLWT